MCEGTGYNMRIHKGEELVPFESRKRVIHIERRGKSKVHISVISVILFLLGIVCILYCLGILLFMGYGTKFFLIWGAAGICLLGLSRFLRHEKWLDMIPPWLKTVMVSLAAAGLILFVVVEAMILSCFGADAPVGADYCLILGAQMKEHGPSDVLRRRLDAAIVYLEDNPDTKVIVSGGKGSNEPVSEALGMYTYLTEHGIEESRILLEEESGNTWGNFYYSSKLLDISEDTVVVVTNNFHVFRAVGIAGKMGYENVHGLAASSYPYMVPNNLLREFLGVIKDFLVGNM